MKLRSLAHIVVVALLGFVLWSCANIGSPEGGPRDYRPPVLVKSSPPAGTLNFKGNKVQLTFDEIVQLKDQQKKVVVSPTQKNAPVIKALGKGILIELNDEMKPNTTYNFDFSDAIQDNNEGNRLEGFSFAFSTGDSIDTLQVSGIVLRAKDLEPMQHVLVGVYSNLEDSAFSSVPMERISRTNDKGEFTIHNLKAGRYRIFALNDLDGNYKMARTEDMAFYDHIVVPHVSQFTSQDTTFTFDQRVDTIVAGSHTEYLPNDVLLTMFNENYNTLYLKKSDRLGRNRLHLLFSRPTQLPELNILKPASHAARWYKLERREGNDSLFYWITDSTLIKSDSIVVDLQYQKTDSLGQLVLVHDTINFGARTTNAEIKRAKEQSKELEDLNKEIAKLQQERVKLVEKGKDPTEIDSNIKALSEKKNKKKEVLEVKMERGGVLDVTDTVGFVFDTPIDTVYQDRLHLEKLQDDSTWVEVPERPGLEQQDQYNLMKYIFKMPLAPEGEYRLTIDSLAMRSIYGVVNDSVQFKFKVKSLDDYGYFIVHVNSGDSAFVELLGSGEKLLRTEKVSNGTVEFKNLIPGQYYLRLIKDSNGNGKWDTGNYGEHRQPEEVYYYPYDSKLKIRKSWGREETWNIYETPLNLQKPEKIKKNKPEVKRDALEKKKNPDENGTEEDDEFNSSGFGRNTYSGNKYRDYQRNR